MTFQELIINNKKTLLADGAMGSLLIERGFSVSSCLASLNISDPKEIQKIHYEYQKAGARIITTHSFMASKPALAKQGKESLFKEINVRAVENARSAAFDNTFVAGNLGTLAPYIPLQEPNREEKLASSYYEQAKILASEGVDLIIVETIMDLIDLKAAVRGGLSAIHDKTPLFISITPKNNGALLDNTPLESWLSSIENENISGIGLNCFFDLHEMVPLVESLTARTKLPICIKPNAGIPIKEKHTWVYPLGPKEFCAEMKKQLELPIAIIGGCCGTTPEYIKELAKII